LLDLETAFNCTAFSFPPAFSGRGLDQLDD